MKSVLSLKGSTEAQLRAKMGKPDRILQIGSEISYLYTRCYGGLTMSSSAPRSNYGGCWQADFHLRDGKVFSESSYQIK